MKTILKKFLGMLCILAGIALGLLPLVPGVLLVLVGLELLGVPLVPWDRIRSFTKRARRDDTAVHTREEYSTDTDPSVRIQK